MTPEHKQRFTEVQQRWKQEMIESQQNTLFGLDLGSIHHNWKKEAKEQLRQNQQLMKEKNYIHDSSSHRKNQHDPNDDPDSMASLVIVANATFRSPSLPLSETMPHIHFPIGTGDPQNDGTLCAMIDSGAGCNLGRKAYHLSIHEKFPKLVLAIESEVNQDEWQNINIGHIDADGQPVVISAVIVYKTPYEIDGHPVNIRVGLADKTAINTIFGITFLRSSESVVFFGGSTKNKDQLVSTKLGITLPIHMQPPTYTNEAPDFDPRSSAAFHTSNNPVAASGFLVSSDTTAMIGPHIAEQPPEDGDDFLICQLN